MNKYEDGYKFGLDEYSDVAIYCYENGRGYITEIESDNGERRFELVIVPEPSDEMLAEQARLKAAAEAEAQRVPDLEDATVELADYVVSLEERIAELEAKLEANNG